MGHIPKRLHWNSKKSINEFYLGEELYWRLGKKDASDPYRDISLYEVSINRQGNPKKPISEPSDVLYNTTAPINTGISAKYDSDIIVLKINEIFEANNCSIKKSISGKDSDENPIELSATMKLIHDPLCCMYPHSMFRFTYEGEIVTKENYESTLGSKKPKALLSNLRRLLKFEMTNMKIRHEVKFPEQKG